MSPIRVMLADDHKLVRGGLSALLKGIGGVEVVAEANDGREAIQLCESHQPDIGDRQERQSAAKLNAGA